MATTLLEKVDLQEHRRKQQNRTASVSLTVRQIQKDPVCGIRSGRNFWLPSEDGQALKLYDPQQYPRPHVSSPIGPLPWLVMELISLLEENSHQARQSCHGLFLFNINTSYFVQFWLQDASQRFRYSQTKKCTEHPSPARTAL